jgi:hypothetical protein
MSEVEGIAENGMPLMAGQKNVASKNSSVREFPIRFPEIA